MNPQTTDGIAARNSMTILKVSFSFGLQNSDIKIAAPSPKGTAINIANAVTLNVPIINASVPYLLLFRDVGYHSSLVKNSDKFNPPKRKPAPSLNTKKKIPKTKIIQLIPHNLMNTSITDSQNDAAVAELFC